MENKDRDVALVLSTKKMSKLKQWLLLRKPLPKAPTDEFLDPADYTYVSDGDVVIGETYMTKLKEKVTVLDNTLVFMGYSCLVEYSNGAIRWNPYYKHLYEVAD